jgi:hypothetical protein
MIYDPKKPLAGVDTLDEDTADATGYYLSDGARLMELLLNKNQ